MKKFLFYSTILIFVLACKDPLPKMVETQSKIKINQIGYYPDAKKNIVVADNTPYSTFSVVDVEKMISVFEGQLSKQKNWKLAGEKVQVGDFSVLRKTGTYAIYIKDLGYSFPFEIKQKVLSDVFKGSIKALYYQRASIALEEKYAGKWHRKMGHPDTLVMFHQSSKRDTTMTTSSPGGWYDAGDYNKYVVNGAFPLGQHFQLYEQYPQIINDKDLNIPESGNQQSDYLDELTYELNWLLTMQDTDGGVFHKVTTKNFEDMIMPHEASNQKYMVGKGTAATLNFAASTAQAYRIFKNINELYAQKCLNASQNAWKWALEHQNMYFENPSDISTGAYGDKNFDSEFMWAAAELFVATKNQKYLDYFNNYGLDFNFRSGDGWTNYMQFLGMYSFINDDSNLPEEFILKLKNGIIKSADDLLEKSKNGAYFQPISKFTWGSNSDLLNAGMIICQAYRLQNKPEYLNAVQEIANYMLGKNAVGYSFVTGFGDQTPMHIHHRQSAADTVKEPVPGLLSGGPSIQQLDKKDGVVYPDNAAPMQSWVDQEGSYVTNEICLNWNAPLTYILGFLEQESK